MRGTPLGPWLSIASVVCGVLGCDPEADESTFSPITFERSLNPTSPQNNAYFGEEVALRGNYVAVTSPFEFADLETARAYSPEGDTPPDMAEGVTYLFDLSRPVDLAHPAGTPLRLVARGAAPGDSQVPIRELFLNQPFNPKPWPVQSVALSEDFLVVGAPGQDGGPTASDDPSNAGKDASASDSGAVFVYDRKLLQQGLLEPIQFLKAPDAQATDLFGYEVALSKQWLAITAPNKDSAVSDDPNNPGGPNSGVVYLYERKDGRFVFDSAKTAPTPRMWSLFGSAVALVDDPDGELLVVGAAGATAFATDVNQAQNQGGPEVFPGGAYVYRHAAKGWRFEIKLEPAFTDVASGFGAAVRASPKHIVVGAPAALRCPNDAGAAGATPEMAPAGAFGDRGTAYLFTRDGDSWKREQCFHPAGSSHRDIFGDAVAVSDDRFLIGAGFDDGGSPDDPDDAGVAFSGAAYLYERAGAEWEERVYIKAPRVSKNDVFGYGVDMDEHRLVIGAPKHLRTRRGAASLPSAGIVYVFDLVADP